MKYRLRSLNYNEIPPTYYRERKRYINGDTCPTNYGVASGHGCRYWGQTQGAQDNTSITCDVLNFHKQEVTHEFLQ